jgi:signal transduction histidine kinase
MSIRLRLTVLYSVILALTLTAFSLALYLVQAQYTLGSHKRDLEMQARRIALGVTRALTEPERRDVRPGTPFRDRLFPFDGQQLRDLRARDRVHVLDAQGNPVDLPANQGDEALPLSEGGRQALLTGQPWGEIATIEGERLLVHNQPIMVGDQVVGVVQVARSLADRDRSLRALGVALVVGSALATLAAFGIGWGLAGVTLHPIERITQTTRAIGAERDLSRRVPYHGPNDEIGQLAATLNGMLAELEDAYQQLERALDLQRTFVADVSHELRTPLTTLRGNLALLRREPPIEAEEQEDVLEDMVDESERLICLVNDLLTLARAEAGRLLQSERVPVAALIEDVCRQARLLDPSRTIVCDLLHDVDVIADRGALKQVLLVLLDNAITHAQGTITVITEPRADASCPSVAIGVHDDGPGIEPEMRSRLFERFFRGDRARQTSGLGLGLPIAKALVEAQKGTLSVDSQAGRGSTFTVTLPLYADPGE